MGFFQTLADPTLSYLRNALFAGLLSSVLFGILGSMVTVKRIASLAGAISHAVLGGIGMALYFQNTGRIPWFSPLLGAIVFALLAAGLIAAVSLRAKQREDTIINAIWAIGMSLGILFMARTPGYAEPSRYLFGNILLISRLDILLLAILDIVVIFLAWRFYPQLKASAFDEEFARVRGLRVDLVFLAILAITAVAVVLLQSSIGIVMVIAMLTLPAGTAAFRARSLSGMMLLAILFAVFFSVGGLVLGWASDLPVGAMTVVLAGAVYLLSSALSFWLRKKLARQA